jgi:hypothetical protein
MTVSATDMHGDPTTLKSIAIARDVSVPIRDGEKENERPDAEPVEDPQVVVRPNRRVVVRQKVSSIMVRKRVAAVSFLCALQYFSDPAISRFIHAKTSPALTA